MPLDITTYVDPGVYQQEVVVPGSGSATSLPLAVGLIGVGAATKRAVNEAVIRGKIFGEAVTFSSAKDTLANRAVRRQSQATLWENGVAHPSSDWQFNNCAITSNATTAIDLTTRNVLSLSLDGKTPIVIYFTAVPSTAAAAKTGTSNGVVVPRGATTASTTMAEVAASINAALAFMTDAQLNAGTGQGYGSAYAGAASTSAGLLVVTSPVTGSGSDVATYASFPATVDVLGGTLSFTNSQTATLADGGKHGKTIIQLIATFNAASTYTIDYVSPDTATDSLLKASVSTPLKVFKRVGNFQGVTNYAQFVDYGQSTNNITWNPGGGFPSAAKLTSLAVGTGFNVSANETITLSIDGKTAVDIHLAVLASAPPGWTAPSSSAAATVAEVVNNINAVLAASQFYGPQYATVAASIGSGTTAQVTLTSPSVGTLGVVEVSPSTSGYAGATIFGIVATQLPFDVRGLGASPAAGATYFVTYDYTRPTSDYNLPKQYFNVQQAFADIGSLASNNPLAIATSLCFKNGAPSVYVVQVDDHLTAGAPTQVAVDNAMTAAAPISAITELVVLDTRSALMVDLWNLVNSLNSPAQARPCRAWYGMAKGTAAGDKDTPGTFTYTSVVTLAVPGDSPGRGRHILVAPPQGDVMLALDDGTVQTVTVDGTYLAAAVAARFTARTSVAQSLVNQTINGFTNVSDDPTANTFPVYSKTQRGLLADSGVCVITGRAGKLLLIDPLTTERGGGRLAEFEEPQLSTQKDTVVSAVTQALSSNVQGVTPSDLSDFILTIKQIIGNTIVGQIKIGTIAPFRDSQGRTRDINYATDIVVTQRVDDQRKYNFQYFFNGRYPAKYFFGQYSVDNPFFSASTTGLTA
jgi:hypothetical protein